MRRFMILSAVLALSPLCHAQSLAPQDDFLGRSDVSCPAPGHRVAATFTVTGAPTNIVTFTYNNLVSISNDPKTINGNQYDYDVTISGGPNFRIAINEPQIIGGTGTGHPPSGVDWAFVNDQLQGGFYISSVNTVTGVVTLTSDQTITSNIAGASGWVEPGRYYNPFTQPSTLDGFTTTAAWSVNVPGRGTTYPICDPEQHYVYIEANSAFCDANTNCDSPTSLSLSATAGAITESGGVVSTTIPAQSGVSAVPTITPGTTTTTIYGVSDPSYNVSSVVVQSNPSVGVITYNQSTTNPSAIGGVLTVTTSGSTSGPYMLISETQTGGVVTATFALVTSMGMGAPVTLTGAADTTYNCNYNVTGWVGNFVSLTPASGCTPSGTATQGGTMKLNGYLGWPARFSSTGQAVQGLVTEAKGIGFNAVGEDSTPDAQNNSGFPAGGWSGGNINRWPSISPGNGTVLSPTLYASGNKLGYTSQAVHSFVAGLDHKFCPNSGCTIFSAGPNTELDWPDPNFFTYGVSVSSPSTIGGTGNVGLYQTMSAIGGMADDTDINNYPYSGNFWWGIQNAPNGQGGSGGSSVAMFAAETDPHQVVVNHNGDGSLNPMFFPTDTVFVKSLSSPTGCWAAVSITAPSGFTIGPSQTNICGSWLDWAYVQYGGSISALNAAYGSNYTKFGSAETVVSQTSPSGWTGNGSTATFSTTLTAPVTPGSLHIYMQPGGTGPIYLISGDCPFWPNSSQSTGNGCPTVTAGEGTLMEATTTWPGSSGNTATVQAGYLFSDTGHTCIWYATNHGALTNSWSATSCSGTQVNSAVTWQAVGPTINQASSTVTYSSGALSITFNAAVPSGTVIYVSYTSGGFSEGKGLSDEDGIDTGCGFACVQVTTSGTTATYSSGPAIPTGGQWNGLSVLIAGSTTVFHIVSTTSTTFTTSVAMPTNSSPVQATVVDSGDERHRLSDYHCLKRCMVHRAEFRDNRERIAADVDNERFHPERHQLGTGHHGSGWNPVAGHRASVL